MLRYWQPWRRFLVMNVDCVKKWEWLYYKILDYLYPSDAMIYFEPETMEKTTKALLVCSRPGCKKTMLNYTFAFWMDGKPYCSVLHANKSKQKMEKVDRWKAKA